LLMRLSRLRGRGRRRGFWRAWRCKSRHGTHTGAARWAEILRLRVGRPAGAGRKAKAADSPLRMAVVFWRKLASRGRSKLQEKSKEPAGRRRYGMACGIPGIT